MGMKRNAGQLARQMSRNVARIGTKMNITRMIFLMLALGSAYPHHQITWVPSVWSGLQHWSPQLLQWHTWLFEAEGLAMPSKSLFSITVPYDGVLIELILMRYRACTLF